MNRKFDLIINDDRQAAWMEINNSFTAKTPEQINDWNTKTMLWYGLLFQLGSFKSLRGDDMPGADLITIVGRRGTKTYSAQDLAQKTFWFNIIDRAEDSQKLDPMKVEHLDALFIGPDEKRKLHQWIEPLNGGITLWTEQGYDLRAQPTAVVAGGDHPTGMSYRFSLAPSSKFVLEVYADGDAVYVDGDATHLILQTENRAPGGTKNNPPQDPPGGG